ncbi:MAG: glycosyltransferase family 4 protein [Planctomycetota bacterium]
MSAGDVVDSLVLIANARMPSHRAQSLQVAQMGGAFARAGLRTTLLYARRRDTPPVEDLPGLWDYYELPPTPRPAAEPIGCIDGIDALPRWLQYFPARLQELTFGRSAARRVRSAHPGARVLSREVESAHALRDRPRLFLEMHRVPGGRVRRKLLTSAAAAADGVVAISGGVQEDLLALGVEEHKLIVEHDAFEASRFANLPSRSAAREQLGVPAERPLVVYTGGLLEWKGVDLLIEAAREIPDAFFLIAGGMLADVARLRRLASGLENVRLDGFQHPVRVATYLAAGDLGVVPNRSTPAISARYTSPLKVFESMAAGLPLVASDLPSLREVLPGELAVFVAPDDPRALAAGIRRLLGDEAERRRLAAAVRSAAGAYTWDARAARLLSWMDEREAARGIA